MAVLHSTGTAKAVKLQVCSMPAALSQGDLPYNIRAGAIAPRFLQAF